MSRTFLTSLPEGIISRVACLLPVESVSALDQASTPRRIPESVWRDVALANFGHEFGALSNWPQLSTHRNLCLFLGRYYRLVGLWAGDTHPRGQLLRVTHRLYGPAGSTILGERVALIADQSEVSGSDHTDEVELEFSPVFEIVPSECKCCSLPLVRASCRWFPRTHAGIWKERTWMPEDPWQFYTDADPPLPSTIDQAIYLVPSDPHHFTLRRPVGAPYTRTEEEDLEADLSLTESGVEVRFNTYTASGIVPVERYASRVTYTSVTAILGRPPLKRATRNSMPFKTNLWWSNYGPHGPEAIVLVEEGDQIMGVKLQGDPNVPALTTSFVVSTEALFQPENISLVGNKTIVQLHRGKCRIAQHDFSHPSWTFAFMLRYEDGDFGLVLELYSSVLQFQPLNVPLPGTRRSLSDP